MKNILIVYPELPNNTYWGLKYALRFSGKKCTITPLAAATVAAMLPKGYNIRFLDLNVEPLSDHAIKSADCVFITSMTVQRESAEKVAIRAKYFGKPVVMGGHDASHLYWELAGLADSLIIGEAEPVFDIFLRDLEKGKLKKAYARPVIRKRGCRDAAEIDQMLFDDLKKFFGKNADIKAVSSRPDMSLLPVPRFDLFKIDSYACMSVQYSRGCPNHCEFCNEGASFGHTPRVKKTSQFINELKAICDLGYRGAIFIVDDNFIGHRKKVKEEVLPAIIDFQKKRGYPLSIFVETSMDLAKDEELLALMRDAGFTSIFVGYETPVPAVLKSMNKKQNLGIDPLKATHMFQKYGLEVMGGFIFGYDTDPDDAAEELFKFCQSAGIPGATMGLLAVTRGSQLYHDLQKEDRILAEARGNNTHLIELNFIPGNGKDTSKILHDYRNLLARLYDPKNYFARCEVFLANLGKRRRASVEVKNFSDFITFAKSFKTQAFSYYGPSYIQFLVRSLVFHPALFPEAVKAAVKGHHYFKITENALKT
ncbi:MAG: B12-binding domain-containing radical SAM protein [bacterium]|nr:B12-binding domain-containing radical SAM protein [bacterium]